MTLDETIYLNAARAGDQEAFAQLVEPYRREFLVHRYRILGSFEGTGDMLQEALVRAWRRLDSLERRSSLRAWLYKIAPKTSLDALDGRRARGLPKELYPRGDPAQPLPPPLQEAKRKRTTQVLLTCVVRFRQSRWRWPHRSPCQIWDLL